MSDTDPLLAAVGRLKVGVMLLDAHFRVTFYNQAQGSIFRRLGVGRSASEVVGSPVANCFPILLKDEWEGAFARVMRSGETAFWQKLPCPRVGPSAYMAVSLSPLEMHDGEAGGAVCLTEDVTKDVAIERELIKKERLALVGQSSVALLHDVTNPLTAILGATEALLFSQDLPAEAARRLQGLKLNVLRVVEITRRLRELEEIQLTEYLQGAPTYLNGEPPSA
jgi:PAS domain S-box-containing protein